MQQLCLTEEDIKLRKLVCQLLQEVFYEVYPEASVVPFGSTVSGVGWEGSDLDVCLLTPSQQDDAAIDYSLVVDVLRSFAPGCINIIPVLTAKCPLIKFTHQPSGLSCDLSVNNRYGKEKMCYICMEGSVCKIIFTCQSMFCDLSFLFPFLQAWCGKLRSPPLLHVAWSQGSSAGVYCESLGKSQRSYHW